MAAGGKFEPTISIENAHDVRRLRACDHCGDIGDSRYMPVISRTLTVHGGCALAILGEGDLTRLALAERRKLTLREIGPQAMTRLVETCPEDA